MVRRNAPGRRESSRYAGCRCRQRRTRPCSPACQSWKDAGCAVLCASWTRARSQGCRRAKASRARVSGARPAREAARAVSRAGGKHGPRPVCRAVQKMIQAPGAPDLIGGERHDRGAIPVRRPQGVQIAGVERGVPSAREIRACRHAHLNRQGTGCGRHARGRAQTLHVFRPGHQPQGEPCVAPARGKIARRAQRGKPQPQEGVYVLLAPHGHNDADGFHAVSASSCNRRYEVRPRMPRVPRDAQRGACSSAIPDSATVCGRTRSGETPSLSASRRAASA